MRDIHRRQLLIAGGALVASPASVLAQQPAKVRRIGFLSPDSAETGTSKQLQTDFSDFLRKLGYSVGRDLLIEWRWGDGQVSKLSGLAEELVRLKIDLIVARTNEPIAAAMKATGAIPIVMFNGNFPVEVGFVNSLAKPGGNVTGTAYIAPETLEKVAQLLKEAAPRVTRVGGFGVGGFSTEVAIRKTDQVYKEAIERAAVRLGMTYEGFDVGQGSLAEVVTALEKMVVKRVDAVLYLGSPRYRKHASEIAAFLRDRRIASVSSISGFVEIGGLLHYGPDVRTFMSRTASYVDRILKGAKAADLPVELPTKYELGVNLKTAKALGLTVPQSILVRADRVID